MLNRVRHMLRHYFILLLLLSLSSSGTHGEEDLTSFYEKLSAAYVKNPRRNTNNRPRPQSGEAPVSPHCPSMDGGASCSSDLFTGTPRDPHSAPTQARPSSPFANRATEDTMLPRAAPRRAPPSSTRGSKKARPGQGGVGDPSGDAWSLASLAAKRPPGTAYGFMPKLRGAWERRAWDEAAGLLQALAARVSLLPHVQAGRSEGTPTAERLASQLSYLAGTLQASPESMAPEKELQLLALTYESLFLAKYMAEGVFEPDASMEGLLEPGEDTLALLQRLDPAAASQLHPLLQRESMRSGVFAQARDLYSSGQFHKGLYVIVTAILHDLQILHSYPRELSTTYFPLDTDCDARPQGWPWGCGRLESQLGFMQEMVEGPLSQAMEARLLHWQLKHMAQFGEYSRSPDLPCDPLEAPENPKLAVVLPFVASEAQRVVDNLQFWDKFPPCQGGNDDDDDSRDVDDSEGASATGAKDASARRGLSGDWPHRHRTDLVLLFAGDAAALPAPFSDPQQWSRFVAESASLQCFENVRVLLGNLTAAEQSLPGRGHVDNTGQVNLLFRMLGMNTAHGTDYDYALLMESDVKPIRPGWLPRMYGETLAPVGAGGVWMKGCMQNPPWTNLGVISEHHYHMNMNAILRLSDPCFVRLLEAVEGEFPRDQYAFDAAIHLFMRSRGNYRHMQRFASRFVYGDFLINWLRYDAVHVDALIRDFPFAVLVHAKNVQF
eukprot:jgi/Mesvir1/11826/Mv00178-RA.1